jgi:hypothetical protein
VSAKDADRNFFGQTNSARVVLKAYRQMLVFQFLGASAVIAVLFCLVLVPYLIFSASVSNPGPALSSAASGSLPPAAAKSPDQPPAGQKTDAQPPSAGSARPSDPAPAFSIFVVVVMAGAVGAFFSSLQRLYDFDGLPQILYDEQLGDEYLTLFVYSLIPPLIGGIAAAVLYLIFAGELLSVGTLFPKFGCKQPSSCVDFATLLAYWGPDQAIDYAKAIVWGFVAGFAERLVPTLLNSFAQKADGGDDAPGSDRSAGGPAGATPIEANAIQNGDRPTPAVASRGLANQGRTSRL